MPQCRPVSVIASFAGLATLLLEPYESALISGASAPRWEVATPSGRTHQQGNRKAGERLGQRHDAPVHGKALAG
jgi:hypothetical protein